MRGTSTPRSVRRLLARGGRAAILALTLIAGVALCGASIWPLLVSRERILDNAAVESANLARAFGHHVDRTFAEISMNLDVLIPQLAQVLAVGSVDEASVHRLVREHLDASHYLRQAAVSDAGGALLASSSRLPVGTVTVADRAYFHFHRATPGVRLYIDDPFVSRVSGQKVLSVSRRLSAPDGRFLGVIVAAVDLDHFVAFYREVALGEGGAIELLNERGVVLAGSNAAVSDRSRINAPRTLATTAPVATGHFAGSDGVTRVGATARVPAHALFISVARGHDQILTDWRGQVVQQSAALAGVMAVVLCLGVAAYRSHGRLARVASAQRRQFQLLESINTSTADAIVVADRRGRTLVYNPSAVALFGRPPPGVPVVESSSFAEHESERPLPRERHPLVRALNGETVENMDLVVRRSDTAAGRHVTASARPVHDADSGIDGGVMVCRDVTDYRSTQLQLQQAQRLKAVGQLTGGVAHDFNNVLTVIVGNLDIIATDAALREPERQAVAEVIRAAERGATITRSLLSFSRQQPLQPQSIDINGLVVEAAKLLRPTLGEQVEISTALEDGVPPALVDPAQLQTAILNLAINARDAMPGGGKLLIETGRVLLDEAYAARHSEVRTGVYALIAVTDTGTGMTRDVLDKVFEPFFTTKGPGRGTGLGLSMVYGFVRQSGGHVKVYSEPGVGTTVKVYLPLSDLPAQSDGEAAERPSGGSGELILAVEDDPDVRAFVHGQLVALNYRVVEAATGREALDLLPRHPDIALLFTDVVLPEGMSGRDLADAVAAIRPDLPVLYTSGYTENAIVHHGRLDAGVRLLSKPYRHATLAAAIRDALAKAPAS